MDLKQLAENTAAALRDAGIENYRCEARWLITEISGCSETDILLNRSISSELAENVNTVVASRCRHAPLQYLLGSAFFGEFELLVTPAVLIPRPETEILADYAVKHLSPGQSFLDIGTGSGAVAIYVAVKSPSVQVSAVDISPDALEIAKKNALRIKGAERISFLQSDLFSALGGRQFDLIGANLPYVTFDEYSGLEPEVKDHEPQIALTAADEGFEIIHRCIRALPEHLAPGGRAVFEMSEHQTARCAELLQKSGFETEIFADQFGVYRFVAGRKL